MIRTKYIGTMQDVHPVRVKVTMDEDEAKELIDTLMHVEGGSYSVYEALVDLTGYAGDGLTVEDVISVAIAQICAPVS